MTIEPGTTMREWEKREREQSSASPGLPLHNEPPQEENESWASLSDADLVVLRAALPILQRLVGR